MNCSALASSIPTSINADQTQVSKLSDLDVTPPPPPKVKQIRKPSIQAQRHRANQLELKKHHSNAHKQATTWFADEVEKKKKGATNIKSAAFVCEAVNKEFGTNIHPRTVQKYVKEGLAGDSPKKKGTPSVIPDFIYSSLCEAFKLHVQINQYNGNSGDNVRKILACKLNKVMKNNENLRYNLLNQILKDTAINIGGTRCIGQEERRIRWTTYHNIKSWFDNWGHDLVELGFATKSYDGSVEIPNNQLQRIINIDETCLTLDGGLGKCGGCPSVVYVGKNLPNVGKAFSKTSITVTMITGSTAAGEAIPPHFQFSTMATSENRMRLRSELLQFMPYIKGKFGCNSIREWPVTFGMNLKGGMDDAEYEKYLFSSIIPLFPDLKDQPGLRIMLKVDSGPGRLQPKLLSTLRLIGAYKYPGVPNTTAVTQETDQNYGQFKTKFRSNLDFVTQQRLNSSKPCNIQPWLIGLLVFGAKILFLVALFTRVHLMRPSQRRNVCLHGKKLGLHPSRRSASNQSM